MPSSVLQPALQDALAASLADGGFADTKFYLYSKRVKGKPNAVHTLRTVYANSTILKAASPYFNGYSYDDSEDSDLEDDDEDEPRRGVKTEYNSTASPVSETTQVSSSRAMHTVVINDAAATTADRFAPLKSQGVQYREAEKSCGQTGPLRAGEHAASVIRSQLNTKNILDELFSPFTSKHRDILRTQVDFFRANCRDMTFVTAMRHKLGRVASGELPHAVPAMVALYEEWVYDRPASQPQWTEFVPPPQPVPSYSRTPSPSMVTQRLPPVTHRMPGRGILPSCPPSLSRTPSPVYPYRPRAVNSLIPEISIGRVHTSRSPAFSRTPSPVYCSPRPIYPPMPSTKPGSTPQLPPSPQPITPQTPSHLSSALSSVTRTEPPGIGSEPALASGRASRSASRGSSIPGLPTISASSVVSFPGGQEVPHPQTTSCSFCSANPSSTPAPAPPAVSLDAVTEAAQAVCRLMSRLDAEPLIVPAGASQNPPAPSSVCSLFIETAATV
ncbi:hypothetical protein B0H21DRAFT_707896 [Amylocystis lapponica]|nr:hypothetical protein B0H21DRAFT_707896 [Amylocystis lapponica]